MKTLTLDLIKKLFPNAISRKYERGQIICYQGDKPQHIFYVESGHIRLYDIDDEGNEKVMHIIGPGNIFPMLYAFEIAEDVPSFYSTIENSKIIAIPKQQFLQTAESNIEFSNALTHWFLIELRQMLYRVSSLEKSDSREKILHALKYLADYAQANGNWQKIDFPITQQFIADLTGLTRETVSAIMHELSMQKVVRSRKRNQLEVRQSELAKIS